MNTTRKTINRLFVWGYLLTHMAWATEACAELETFRSESLAAIDGSKHDAEYFRIPVPVNWRKSGSTEISVACIRIRSRDTSETAPIFYLAGGPGGSGIDAVRQLVTNGGDRFFHLIGRDIVGIDQRGVGLSEPNLELEANFGLSPTEPGQPDRMLTTMRAVCREAAEAMRSQGIQLSAYNTQESAADIDAIRRGLGYDQVVLWGASYGTHLAMDVIRQFPGSVSHALLSGPEGPDHTWKLPSDTQRALEQIDERLRTDKVFQECIPDLLAMLEEVLEKLRRTPETVSVNGHEIGISAFDVQRLLAGHIGTVRNGGDQIPKLVWEMHQGDFHEVARQVLTYRQEAGLWSIMNCVMDAASGASDPRREQIRKETSECLLGNAANFPVMALAETWEVPSLNPDFRRNPKTEIPIQFIVGELDSRTPLRNANELAKGMKNSATLVVENVGHNDVPLGQPDLRAAWSRFLRTKEMTSGRIATAPIRFVRPRTMDVLLPAGAVDCSLEQLKRYAGEYRFDDGNVISIRADIKRLIATIPGKGDYELWPRSKIEFFADVAEIPPILFRFDDQDRILGMEGNGRFAHRLRFHDEQSFVELSLQELEQFAGRYDYGPSGYAVIFLRDGQLWWHLPGQSPLAMRPVSLDELRWTELDARAVFDRNAKGEIHSLTHEQSGQRITARRH